MGFATRSRGLAAAALLLVGSHPVDALAHSGGVSFNGCTGCHGAGNFAVSLGPATLSPGQTATVTIDIDAGAGAAAGIFIKPSLGSVETIANEGLVHAGDGLSHASPKPMSNGQTRFRFNFTPPSAPGAVRFTVSSVVANDNGNNGGDAAVEATFDVLFGCDPQEFYRDFDGDGYGRLNDSLTHCEGEPPAGYAEVAGDCDDNRESVYPGAAEYCNHLDDDCDDTVDEDAIPVEQYPDADGDGYYGNLERESGETFVGCVPTDGWAAEAGDCQPNNPSVNPGAEEVCNLDDDNCDGRIDEGVRPTCGEGWCRREAFTCEAQSCYPGEPMAEQCNYLDDDCDGTVDNGELCEAGLACIAGVCQPDEGPPASDSGSGTSGGSGGSEAEGGGAAGAESSSSGGCRASQPGGFPLSGIVLLLGLFGSVAAHEKRHDHGRRDRGVR